MEIVKDLGSPKVRRRIQTHFDLRGDSPPEGSDLEYSYYFEELYPTPADRRELLDRYIVAGRPSYGHRVLSHLMVNSISPVVWTTNFDRVIEDSVVAKTGSTTTLTVADLKSADVAGPALSDRRFPLLVKLHGDYQSDGLKNISEELRKQNESLEHSFADGLDGRLLIVHGYSGRDDSVVNMVESAISEARSTFRGMVWCLLGDEEPRSAVRELVSKVNDQWAPAGFIRSRPFDEFMGTVGARLITNRDELRSLRPPRDLVVAPEPPEPGKSGWPIIRTNAFPVLIVPAHGCLVECDIGGSSEVRAAIENSGSDIAGARVHEGVICFGALSDIERTFGPFGITNIDEYPLAQEKLVMHRTLQGLIVDLIQLGLQRVEGIESDQRRANLFVRSTKDELDGVLSKLVRGVKGVTPAGETWSERVKLSLRTNEDSNYLLMSPVVFLESEPTPDFSDFANKRYSQRYNRQWDALLSHWQKVIFGQARVLTLSAFESGVEFPAEIEIGYATAFSRVN